LWWWATSGGHVGFESWLERDHLVAPAQPPLVGQLIAEATAGGAGLGLEARIWAAIDLLRTGGQLPATLDLADEAAATLDEYAAALGPAADQWRLLLAFHAGHAGHPAIAGRLLAHC
jgi:hypothetical protein